MYKIGGAVLLTTVLLLFVAIEAYATSLDETPTNTELDTIYTIQDDHNDIIQINYGIVQDVPKRYIILGGHGSGGIGFGINGMPIQKSTTQQHWEEGGPGFLTLAVLSVEEAIFLAGQGYHVIEDFKLDFDNVDDTTGHYYSSNTPGIGIIDEKLNIAYDADNAQTTQDGSRTLQIAGLTGEYDATGDGVTVAIMDTGVDFSNPDMRHAVARDGLNHPIMLDPDGQGIILTNSTFIANIDDNGIMRNYSQELPENITSSVYINDDGVFLDINQGGKGTKINVYNSFYPHIGPEPVLEGVMTNDMKIGDNNRDYIKSMSGMYRFGAIYQGILSGPAAGLQIVPVLVIDSTVPGLYDTIIPDMSTSWSDFTRNNLKEGEEPDYDFDFTDEKPIVLGSGNEFLLYDSDEDGMDDYSAGAVGARVLDIYNVMDNTNSTDIDATLGAVNGTLLPGIDPNGKFFGVMTDFNGHGTASAGVISSSGSMRYDIYNDTGKYALPGVAPDAKILPVKMLWFGDVVYGWLWSAGFEENNGMWEYTGANRADILSNSWSVPTFPNLGTVPGYDALSLLTNMITTPHSLDEDYPGVIMVGSAGNAGHGYGTVGIPNASPLGITVGATNNNVIVGYSSLKDEPRFGNKTEHLNHIIDFSSRGPGPLGNTKPDVVSVGAFGFVPKSISTSEIESTKEAFTTYGGTSMSAPMVAGIAAVIIGEMTAQGQDYDPYTVKNIIMSTATDLRNDPFVQGAGIANAGTALDYIHGKNGVFVADTTASYDNIKSILQPAMGEFNVTSAHVQSIDLPSLPAPMTGWFAGHLIPGERTSATFTIRNPGDQEITVDVRPEKLSLIENGFYSGDTRVRMLDPILEITDAYAPNYIRLADMQNHTSTADFFDKSNPIPDDASLLVLNAYFEFDQFMNSTAEIYANDLRISSLYIYDWVDKDNDSKVTSTELSLVNRGGSWGTVQELRVTDPKEKFEGVPVVGIYPVPVKASYWSGVLDQNATSMEYTVSASYYGKQEWSEVVWSGQQSVTIPPKETNEIDMTLLVPDDMETGVYQGFVKFEGDAHTINMPISFVVKKPIATSNTSIIIKGVVDGDPMFGNGYVKGAFDMTNRYMAGDWRHYYFDIQDESINSAAIKLSWTSNDTSIAVFVADPAGKIVYSNVEPGVFGHFQNWPSVDWLGHSPFSGGGGFFPVDNNNERSTVMHIPINQTGTYTLLAHSTLYGGQSITEPITFAGLFTRIYEAEIQDTSSNIFDTVDTSHEKTLDETQQQQQQQQQDTTTEQEQTNNNDNDNNDSPDKNNQSPHGTGQLTQDQSILNEGDKTDLGQDRSVGSNNNNFGLITEKLTEESQLPNEESGLITIEEKGQDENDEVKESKTVVVMPDATLSDDSTAINDAEEEQPVPENIDSAITDDVTTDGVTTESVGDNLDSYIIGIGIGIAIMSGVIIAVILYMKRKIRWADKPRGI